MCHLAKTNPKAEAVCVGVKIWICFAATGPGLLAVTDSTMNSSAYQIIQESNVRPSVS